MSDRLDLSTPNGVIAHFERRADRLVNDALKRQARGKDHPLHHQYAEFAQDDVQAVKQLFARLQPEVRHG